MKLKSSILIIQIIISLQIQGQIEIGGIELVNSTITKTEEVKSEIFGKEVQGIEYELTSKVEVQVSCSMVSGEWEYKENKYRITKYDDSNCLMYNSIYESITEYWKGKEEWANKYNSSGDFSALPVRDGFYRIKKNLIIPMIKTDTEVEGKAYSIFWHNKILYKVELLKSGGFGGLSSFIKQNLQIIRKSKSYKIEGLIRTLKETKKIIEKKESCV